jgi:hypothetical protein
VGAFALVAMTRGKPRCAACGATTRRNGRQRAFVFTLTTTTRTRSQMRAGFVCAGCARLGWLLVFGGDADRAGPRLAPKRSADLRQLSIDDRLSVFSVDESLAVPSVPLCAAVAGCQLLAGHKGRHVRVHVPKKRRRP